MIKRDKINSYVIFNIKNEVKDVKKNARVYKTLIYNYYNELKTNFKEILKRLKRKHNKLLIK